MATDPFFMMPNWFFDDGHLTAMGVNTFAVYMILRRHSNSQSYECNPSYSSIQKKARIGRTAISGAINYLVQNGYIEIVKTGDATQSSNIYKVFPFDKIKNNQSHLGLVPNKTSPKKQPQLVPYGTETSPNQDYQLVPYGTLNIQTKNIQIEKDKEEKEGDAFLSDSPNQNQAMEQELKSADSANKQDPTPVAPAPLSDAAAELKAKFEGRFERKAKSQWWERYIKPMDDAWREILTEWAFSETSKANFKESLLIVQIEHLRKLSSPCERGNAINSLSNYIRHDDLTSFQLRVDAAIAYEKALASNPTLNQPQETESPQSTIQAMPKVGEVDENGMVLMVDCRWEHFYPKLGRLNKTTGDAEIVWGMNNTHPPDPVDERCQKFLEKVQGNPERLAKLLTAKHLADGDFASYQIQSENFIKAKDGLIAALNQEIQKLLSSQAA